MDGVSYTDPKVGDWVLVIDSSHKEFIGSIGIVESLEGSRAVQVVRHPLSGPHLLWDDPTQDPSCWKLHRYFPLYKLELVNRPE